MSVSISGISSGIDTAALIDASVTAASGPRNALQSRVDDYEDRIEAITELQSLLGTMEDTLEAIEDIEDFRAFSATIDGVASADATADFTIALDGEAIAGSYDITVNALAETHLAQSTAIAATSLTGAVFTVGDVLQITYDGTTHSITIDSDSKSLDGLADAINDIDGVSAYATPNDTDNPTSYIFSIVGDDAGETITFNETGMSGTALGMTTYRAATDASVTVNGVTVTSDTNLLTDIVPGMDLTLTTDGGTTFNVVVDEDPDTIETRIQAFVDSYNAVVRNINTNSVYNADAGIRGPFVGEATVQRVLTGLRNVATTEFTALAQDYDSLGLIGIELDSDGIMSIDSDELDDLLVDKADQVADLFTGTGGFIEAMLARIDLYTDSVDGSLTVRSDSLEDRVEDLEDQIVAQDRRLARLEARLSNQFAAMESLLGTLSSSSQFLSSLLT